MRSTAKSGQSLGTTGGPGKGSEEQKTEKALSQTLPKGSDTRDVLNTIVEQLALCHADELKRLKAWSGVRKQLAVYRQA